MAPFMVGVVAFATFILMDENNNLDPNTAFVSLTLFNMLRQPLNFIPRIIQGLTQVILNFFYHLTLCCLNNGKYPKCLRIDQRPRKRFSGFGSCFDF